jgi:NAD+ diphosphatase
MSVHLLYRRLSSRSTPENCLWILLQENETYVVMDDGRARLPTAEDLGTFAAHDPIHQIAIVGEGSSPATETAGRPVLASTVEAAPSAREGITLERIGYRKLYGIIDDEILALIGRATQIADWESTSCYCGRCGTLTRPNEAESVRTCPACGDAHYPRISPAMIVGVVRDGRLLLASAPRFRGTFYSILAGFVEPGETPEECIHREVWEEVRVRVKNIRYFGSQSWPFPRSLMLGFTAEYESGEITVDRQELLDAGWFAPAEMPPVPTEISISGRIIRWFRDTHGSRPG